jgi:hypothetical protein
MFKQFAVVFGGELAEFFPPRHFSTEEEAVVELALIRNSLKDSSQVQLMVLVPLD